MSDHHTINYVEFPSSDIARTKEFYHQIFGWTFTDWGAEYVSFHGAGIEGGFYLTDAQIGSTHPGSLVVVFSENLEASQCAVEQAGGKISVPIFEFPGGRRFQFTDDSGNELAIWSAESGEEKETAASDSK